jgi:hypothetical protein
MRPMFSYETGTPPNSQTEAALIEVGHPASSVRRQCELSVFPGRASNTSRRARPPEDLRLMRLIDEQ